MTADLQLEIRCLAVAMVQLEQDAFDAARRQEYAVAGDLYARRELVCDCRFDLVRELWARRQPATS